MWLSVAGDFSCEDADMSKAEPSGGAGDGRLEILGEAAASVEPSEEPLDMR